MEIEVLLKRPAFKPDKRDVYVITVKFDGWENLVLEYAGETAYEDGMYCDLKMLMLHKSFENTLYFSNLPYQAEIDSWVSTPDSWTVYDFVGRITGDVNDALIDEIIDIHIMYYDDVGSGHECEITTIEFPVEANNF